MGPELEAVGAHLCLGAEPEGDDRSAMRAGELVRQAPAVRIADVHRRRRRSDTGEQPPLRLEVLLHVAVEVEVVLAQVRERERVEADTVEAAIVRAVGRGLEDDGLVPGVDHLPEQPLQVDRLRGRVRRGPPDAADDPLDGSDHRGRPPVRLEDRAEQMGGRRLAVRPGDPGHGQPLGRDAEEHVGGDRHRRTRGLDDELRHRDVDRALDDERDGTGRDGVRRQVVPVGTGPGHAEEERVVAHAAGVVREVEDLDGPSPDHVTRRERADQRVELHRPRF